MSGFVTIGVLLAVALIVAYCEDEEPPQDWDAEAWKLWKRRDDRIARPPRD